MHRQSRRRVRAGGDVPACERSIGELAGDTVGGELPLRLKARERTGGGSGEPSVDGLGIEAVGDQPELERGDVPADGADGELTLPEKRSAERPERRPRLRPEQPRGREALHPLQVCQAGGRERALDAVDRGRVEPVRLERDLEGGDARAACGTGGTGKRQCRRNGGREQEQAAHSPSVGSAAGRLKRR